MYTFVDDSRVHGLIAAFHEAGKPTAVVCHATCALLSAVTSTGTLVVDGKTWTGFANSEEQFADDLVGGRSSRFGSKTGRAPCRTPTSWCTARSRRTRSATAISSRASSSTQVPPPRAWSSRPSVSEAPPSTSIAVIGVGRVGGPIADRLQRAGHRVSVAASDPGAESVRAILARNPEMIVATPREAVAGAEVVVLATPFAANAGVLAELGDVLGGRVLIDATNPVGPGITHPLGDRSGAQSVQDAVPEARVVKAFSVYGFENLEDNAYPGYDVPPAMPFCGDDPDAKHSSAASSGSSDGSRSTSAGSPRRSTSST